MKPLKTALLPILFAAFFVQTADAYDIPQRRIDLKPYLNVIIPNNLMEWENLGNVVDNDIGFGLGVKARTQINRTWGFVINTSYTDLEVNTEKGLSSAILLTVGFSYSKSLSLGDFVLDAGYGGIAAGGRGIGLFMPSLEYSRTFSERLKLSIEFGWPVANDWFYDFGFVENYGSLAISLGGAVVF
jgi:hypothetical protein